MPGLPKDLQLSKSSKRLIVHLSFLSGILLTASAIADEAIDAEVAAAPPAHIEATQVELHDPVYPRSALYENREGWVLVDFDIGPNGRVHNAVAIDSVGGNVFELAAVNSVGRRNYRPAQIDGKTVFQGRNRSYVTFAINLRTRGSTRRFADRYNDVLELIAKSQLKRAESLTATQFDDWPLNLHELTKLWSLRAQLALIQNNAIEAEVALRRATANNGEWLEKQTFQSLLLALTHIEIELGQFNSAIQTYDRLIRLNPKTNESIVQTTTLIESLRSLIASNRTLETDGVVRKNRQCQSCDDRWSFLPLRDRFKIFNVVGELRGVTMVCDSARVSTAFANHRDWVVPPQLGACRVDIHGNAGTRFSIHQLPNNNQVR